MTSDPIRRSFSSAGVEVTSPSAADRDATIALIERLQHGESTNARAEIRRVTAGRPAILGCTELALAFPDAIGESLIHEENSVYFNSLAIHATALLNRAVV